MQVNQNDSKKPANTNGTVKSAGGKPAVNRNNKKGGAVETADRLHPSWQASKRRQEQQALIKTGPSNKKIKFDDSD